MLLGGVARRQIPHIFASRQLRAEYGQSMRQKMDGVEGFEVRWGIALQGLSHTFEMPGPDQNGSEQRDRQHGKTVNLGR